MKLTASFRMISIVHEASSSYIPTTLLPAFLWQRMVILNTLVPYLLLSKRRLCPTPSYEKELAHVGFQNDAVSLCDSRILPQDLSTSIRSRIREPKVKPRALYFALKAFKSFQTLVEMLGYAFSVYHFTFFSTQV
jgi:hypothetical protein